MKGPFALPAIALIGLSVLACGGMGKHTAREATTSGYLEGDEDIDGDPNGNFDDYLIRDFGHVASAADGHAIATLVKRFFAAAAALDGAGTCSMVVPSLIRRPDLVKAVPDDYIPLGGSAALRGKRCAPMMSLVLGENHRRLVADSTTLVVTSVRVKGDRGVALLGFKATPERYMPVRLENGVWKLEALLDKEIT